MACSMLPNWTTSGRVASRWRERRTHSALTRAKEAASRARRRALRNATPSAPERGEAGPEGREVGRRMASTAKSWGSPASS